MNENFKLNQLYNAYECGNLSFYNTVKYQVEPDEVIERYQTLCSAFMFPIAGRAIITLDNTEFEAKPGTMIDVPPGAIIEYDVLSDESYQYINVFHRVLTDAKFAVDIRAVYSDISNLLIELLALVDSSVKEVVQKELKYYKLFQLLLGQNVTTSSDEDAIMYKLITYIESNFSQAITLATLANIVSKKEHQVSYLFKKYTNQRPIDYLIHYRLSQATEMPKTTDLPISDIAAQVGYQDPFYFSRLFKKHTGISPTAYRNSL